MSDPVRMRDLPGAEGDFAKLLVKSAAPTRPFTAADALRLQAHVAKAATAASSVGAGATSAAPGGWIAAVAPKVVMSVALTVAGGGAYVASRKPVASHHVVRSHAVIASPRSAPAHAVVAPTREAVATTPPVEAAPLAEPAPSHEGVAHPRVPIARVARVVTTPTPPVEAPAPVAPTLNDELRVTNEARDALQHDPDRAVRILADAERSMSGGQLVDERAALTIEALAALGDWNAARTRAARLFERAPRSPQSARIRVLLRRAP